MVRPTMSAFSFPKGRVASQKPLMFISLISTSSTSVLPSLCSRPRRCGGHRRLTCAGGCSRGVAASNRKAPPCNWFWSAWASLAKFFHLFAASFADQFVAFLRYEHICVAETPLDQRRERGWGRAGAAAGDVQNPLADELGGRGIVQLGSRLDLLPLGIGEADASGAARGALVCSGAVAGFGFGSVGFRHAATPFRLRNRARERLIRGYETHRPLTVVTARSAEAWRFRVVESPDVIAEGPTDRRNTAPAPEFQGRDVGEGSYIRACMGWRQSPSRASRQ